jgi:hypothetical protein
MKQKLPSFIVTGIGVLLIAEYFFKIPAPVKRPMRKHTKPRVTHRAANLSLMPRMPSLKVSDPG